MADFLPNPPEVTVKLDQDIYWKNWFQQLWKAHRRNLVVAAVQTVAFTPDLESYFYPCDTTGGAFAVTLPPAVNVMGKQIELYHATHANALTVVCSGADVLSPTTVTPIALASSVVFVSDGISTWYAFPSGTSSSGGSGLATTVYKAAGSGNYTVPNGCTMLEVELQGGGSSGGAGGSGVASAGGGAGGSTGEYIGPRFMAVTAGASLAYVVGAGGTSSAGVITNTGNAGKAGADTTFNGLTAKGSPALAAGGIAGGTGGASGTGGGRLGAAGVAATAVGLIAVAELNLSLGGASGGGGGTNSGSSPGGVGGACDGAAGGAAGGTSSAARGGGAGGAASQGAPGGAGGAGNNTTTGGAGTAGTLGSGGGGGGAGANTFAGGASGAGGDGWIKITAYT